MAKKRSWLPIVAGVAVLLVFLVLAGVIVLVSVVRDRVEIERGQTSETVGDEFDQVRLRFSDPSPMLTFDGRTPQLSEQAKSRVSTTPIEAVNVLAWDPRDGELARVSLPFWLLRFQSKPFRIGDMVSVSGFEDRGVTITTEDIERFGPGILLDYTDSRGSRVLVWSQ
jgi:hypothetical protein